jgi:hypothetical protein
MKNADKLNVVRSPRTPRTLAVMTIKAFKMLAYRIYLINCAVSAAFNLRGFIRCNAETSIYTSRKKTVSLLLVPHREKPAVVPPLLLHLCQAREEKFRMRCYIKAPRFNWDTCTQLQHNKWGKEDGSFCFAVSLERGLVGVTLKSLAPPWDLSCFLLWE